MYNSIYPVNINYRKYNPYGSKGAQEGSQKGNENLLSQPSKGDSYTPASNRINISQILMDFKNTILAINAPQDVQDEVNIYLGLVEKESQKETPSREIIISNLTNASRISDNFIASALGKKSNVVEGWIKTIFRQDINLKSNPNEINPDFLLKFPAKAEEKIASAQEQQVKPEQIPATDQQQTAKTVQQTNIPDAQAPEEIKITELAAPIEKTAITDTEEQPIEIQSSIEESAEPKNIFETIISDSKVTSFSPYDTNDEKAKVLYLQAKRVLSSNQDSADALNMLNEALGYLSDSSNSNIRAAIHFERGKIFDVFDYVDYALRDYHEATKAGDLNLKAQSYFKLGSIYDEFSEFDPALGNYLSSVAYSGEADNLSAQSKVLSKISEMYARIYDVQNAHDYADLAIDAAVDSQNSSAIAKTYSSVAQNYQYLGEGEKALENYKNALIEFSRTDESYEQMGYNYAQAAEVMRQLGNNAKATKLQERSNQYYQKAQLFRDELELAS